MRTVPIILTVALALPAGASAARPAPGRYTGKVAGATIAFRVKAGKVRSLQFGRIVARCDDGSSLGVRVRPLPSRWFVRVRGGRFHKSTVIGNATRLGPIVLSGRFTSRTRARGTLRHRFMYVPTGAKCDTGALRFRVHRVRTGAAGPAKTFAGKTADGSVLQIGMTAAGNGVRPTRMQAKMACIDGGSVTLDVRLPTAAYAGVTPEATFSGNWTFRPPPVEGRAEPSGGGIQLSGRVTPTGLDGAARMSIGFMDGTSCDSGWQRFTIAGNTAAG